MWEEPEWPDVHRCEECSADAWQVLAPDGREILIDVEPLDVVCDGGVWLRANGHGVVRKVDGYSIPEPQWIRERRVSPKSISVACDWEPAGWVWSVKRQSLTAAGASGCAVYSEHKYTCSKTSPRQLAAAAGMVFYSSDADRPTSAVLDQMLTMAWHEGDQKVWQFRDVVKVGSKLKAITAKRHCVTVSSQKYPYGREVELRRSPEAATGDAAREHSQPRSLRRRQTAPVETSDPRQMALFRTA